MVQRERLVYGRRRIKKDGSVFVLEMHKDSVQVKELYSRRRYTAQLGEVVDLLMGQGIIKIPKN